MRILVIEDDPTVGQYVKRGLEEHRCAVDLPLQLPGHPPTPVSSPAISLAELERRHIETVLHNTNWHQGKAASALGISSKTLYRKIREYGFRRPGGVE